MTHSFIAYIDESGDEGLSGRYRSPGKGGGSSHWLAIGATIWRKSRDLDAVRWARAIIDQLPEQKRKKPLHFMELDHPQRLMAVYGICDRPIRSITVIANKPVIPDGTYASSVQFYHHVCRYLIERISWFCRDYRPVVPEGDGRVKLVFSRKRTMDYQYFRDYLTHMHEMENPAIQIHWPVVDIDGLEAEDHGSRYGLQIADIATSGLMAALEPDYYGNVEPRYARLLKPVVFNRKGNYISYGTKMFPCAEELVLSHQQQEFVALFSK